MTNTADIARAMAATMESASIPMYGNKLRLPDRGAIIALIRELRRLFFHAYFGDPQLMALSAENYAALLLERIETALTAQVALALPEGQAFAAAALTHEILEQLPRIQQTLMTDIEATFDGDPAAADKEEIIFAYPGLFAIFVYRIAHELYLRQVPMIPRMMTEYAHSRTGIDIHPGAQIGRILDTLRSCFALAADAEITMEGNPGTLTRKNLESYRAAGVNRLSLGVQSLDDGLLRNIGRIHTSEEAKAAVAMARAAGFDNLNLDLMLGLPGQKPEQWARTLSEAIALSPEHLSCYSLILEEGTPLYAQAEAGACAPLPDEDALCEMDDITERLTRAGGYARYEVSNYAKAGRICRHNVVYWECLPYLGIGCAAHSDMDGTRFYNTEDFDAYLRGAPARTEDAGGRMFERMMMGLRMVRGVDEARFLRDFGRAPEAVWTKSLPRLMREGMLAREDGRLYLTARGMQVMNAVLVEMMEETEA